MSLKLALAALALGLAAASPVIGHVHMAKTAGTSVNGLLASRYERVCGNKGYSYDSYGANLRMAASDGNPHKVKDSIRTQFQGYGRERVPLPFMDEIGFEDCDFISMESNWPFWRRFEDWPLPLELHVPCRDPLDPVRKSKFYGAFRISGAPGALVDFHTGWTTSCRSAITTICRLTASTPRAARSPWPGR